MYEYNIKYYTLFKLLQNEICVVDYKIQISY